MEVVKEVEVTDLDKSALVECTMLVDDLNRFECAPTIIVNTPNGKQQADLQKSLVQCMQSLYGILLHAGVKQMVLSLQDHSSSLIRDKNFQFSIGELPKQETVTEEQSNKFEGE